MRLDAETDLPVLADVLSIRRLPLLRALIHGGPATSSELSRRLCIAPASLRHRVSQLESAGLVTRSTHVEDGLREVIYAADAERVRELLREDELRILVDAVLGI
ncbi:hypothetical protein C5C31_04760 [Rathayibacter rathayi]|uniref:ArsR family transcriptional regulator n=1 Tax=Rathayibacter rathayi TaxID=33887 RepID=A0ABD6WC16_RATRA|nr:hypothetical protein C1O28_07565 [Rathayibacter rathayi]MWV75977.1 MarR family transcriptional regulator [Rathayibacter rathayi NCPPB 2980 = VKM Ac-1601]PPF16223.1 hypothetical protein C5C04_00055 [Rathayibacter rathayi]PPF51795.1 hypothetical protein C5C08_00055 [Rathayibacter rathayi]PPF83402.1 hypothetical protein C5C14_00060 [Rathayibacter rathayi]